MLPTAGLMPQVTAVLVMGVTAALKPCVAPETTVGADGLTTTFTEVGSTTVTFWVAKVALLPSSAAVAVIRKVLAVVPAVKVVVGDPLVVLVGENAPPPAVMVQFTVELLTKFVTLAV